MRLQSRTAAQVTPAKCDFAWAGRVPLGALTIVGGPPGLGKTQLLIGMIARLTRGKLDGDLAGEPYEAIYVSAEDSLEHTLVPRLLAAGGVPDHTHFFDAVGDRNSMQIPGDVANLEAWLQCHPRVRIIVLDPIVAMIPASLNAHRDQHVRQALAPLAAMVDRLQVACVLVMHLNKDREADALNRLSGSIGFGGAARSVLLFASDPDDPRGESGNQRVLAHVKCNVGPKQQSIGYRIEPRRIDGPDDTVIETSIAIRHGDVAVSATDLLTGPTGSAEATARADAREFLLAELADGPVATNTLKTAAEDAGISWRTVERAKQQLKIRARKTADKWLWTIENPKPPFDGVVGLDGLGNSRPPTPSSPPSNNTTADLTDSADWTDDEIQALADRASEVT